MRVYYTLSTVLLLLFSFYIQAQPDRWQQRASYNMDIDFDVAKHQFKGKQQLVYTNNSPDTLTKVFYHLYFNAFQPNSMMDVRSRHIADPDPRVGSRISELSPEEIGYQKVISLMQDDNKATYKMVGTILEVTLASPILPQSQTTLTMEFEGQVPKQIRRSGRDNKEGISYSMAQWYPKLSEYDYEGWHANPYIGREFHGVWGDFDVKINIDKDYVIGGTGYLQNPEQIGHGYDAGKKKVKQKPDNGKLTWHFKAFNVHDFVWAADPDYHHRSIDVPNGPKVHLFYQKGDDTEEWEKLDDAVKSLFQIMDTTFGKYPYESYAIIQGGDGGMEYPMATLITGHRGYNSLRGVIIHEVIHSWYQMILGTNESKYSWMDEGFTTFASGYVENVIDKNTNPTAHRSDYSGYLRIATTEYAEPLTTHADHYKTNRAYGINSYVKGAVTLHQLQYIMGKEAFFKGMMAYYNTWKFKHPNPTDFKRIMEKANGLELDWFFEHWVGTINTIDYGIKSVTPEGAKTHVTLERIGNMPMPVEVLVIYNDGRRVLYYMPLRIMRGEKPKDYPDVEWKQMEDWPWVYPEYRLTLDSSIDNIKVIQIDPAYRVADVVMENNDYPFDNTLQYKTEE